MPRSAFLVLNENDTLVSQHTSPENTQCEARPSGVPRLAPRHTKRRMLIYSSSKTALMSTLAFHFSNAFSILADQLRSTSPGV